MFLSGHLLTWAVIGAVSFAALTGTGRLLSASPTAAKWLGVAIFDDGPGFTCWHTDCYRFRDERWQVVWSQATEIIAAG
jgi:hypothetical protein